jgi:hypothetical protein
MTCRLFQTSETTLLTRVRRVSDPSARIKSPVRQEDLHVQFCCLFFLLRDTGPFTDHIMSQVVTLRNDIHHGWQ